MRPPATSTHCNAKARSERPTPSGSVPLVWLWHKFVLGVAAASVLTASACVTTTVTSPAPVVTVESAGPAMTPEEAVQSEPCAVQLQNICGLMLLYYSVHKQMPMQLEDLQPLAGADSPLPLNCPVANQPYVYVPQGLFTAGKTRRIIVFDASPAHHNCRWCIFIDDSNPKGALLLDVVLVPEELFKTYQPGFLP